MTAWTSPERTDEVDAVEDLACRPTPARRPSITSSLMRRSSHDHHDVVAVDARRRTRAPAWVAGSDCGSPVDERERAAVLPALDLARRRSGPRPRTARCRRGCSGRRWRTRRRRCARRRCGGSPTSNAPGRRPAGRSSSAHSTHLVHSRHAAHLPVELGGDRGRAARSASAGDGQLREHLVEEAGDDEPLGDGGGTPRLSR